MIEKLYRIIYPEKVFMGNKFALEELVAKAEMTGHLNNSIDIYKIEEALDEVKKLVMVLHSTYSDEKTSIEKQDNIVNKIYNICNDIIQIDLSKEEKNEKSKEN